MIEIKHRFTGAVLHRSESATTIKEAVVEAVKLGVSLAGANLADANLAGAYLARADLTGAYLADANLARANLARAYLAGADLADANLAGANLAYAYLAAANLAAANLAGANLARADLAGADLAAANLAGANLADADLAGADLAGADLAGADLAGADLAGAYLRDARSITVPDGHVEPTEPYKRPETTEEHRAMRQRRMEDARKRWPDVPVVENLDAKILDVVDSGKGELNMATWHICETTHCRAGWAIHFAGEKGRALEEQYESEKAGRLIYLVSTGRVPNFFATNKRALEDMRRCVAEKS